MKLHFCPFVLLFSLVSVDALPRGQPQSVILAKRGRGGGGVGAKMSVYDVALKQPKSKGENAEDSPTHLMSEDQFAQKHMNDKGWGQIKSQTARCAASTIDDERMASYDNPADRTGGIANAIGRISTEKDREEDCSHTKQTAFQKEDKLYHDYKKGLKKKAEKAAKASKADTNDHQGKSTKGTLGSGAGTKRKANSSSADKPTAKKAATSTTRKSTVPKRKPLADGENQANVNASTKKSARTTRAGTQKPVAKPLHVSPGIKPIGQMTGEVKGAKNALDVLTAASTPTQ